MTHSLCVCYNSFIVCVPWLIQVSLMTYSYVCHDSFVWKEGCEHVKGPVDFCVWHDSFMCVPWLIHMCAMTHSYVCHTCVHYISVCMTQWYVSNYSFLRVTWLIHSYVCYDSFIHMCALCVCITFLCAWLNHTFQITHSYVWHDSFIHMCAMTHSYVCHMCVHYISVCMTQWYVSNHSFICVTWLTSTTWAAISNMNDSFMYVPSPKNRICAMTHPHVCAMTHSHVCYSSFIFVQLLIHTERWTSIQQWPGKFLSNVALNP